MRTCSLRERMLANDEAMISPSHSPFFTASELQRQKRLTLRLKLSVTMRKTCHQQPFVWA